MKTNLYKIGRLLAVTGAAFTVSQVALTAPAAPADTPLRAPTVETLAQFPGMTGFQISPDGKHMIAIGSR